MNAKRILAIVSVVLVIAVAVVLIVRGNEVNNLKKASLQQQVTETVDNGADAAKDAADTVQNDTAAPADDAAKDDQGATNGQ
ncbi:MAG: hypothetical protein IJR97_13575 [Clostridia bacterium]|nr:hypothetical protein [Clostridia bacterium]